MDSEAWVVEWSPSQRCIHIDTLGRVLEVNRRICLCESGTSPSGFVAIAIFDSPDDAAAFAQEIEPALVDAWRRRS